ncbi:MAG: [FeFe] hydrogenase H-cluster radical SAM maturase HydG [Desulfuromonadales bacterium]|nr:[FeFe] hydrogenase H-cluster radical SAM maturase HydG [Desulfuromonadales bacterium]
MGSMPSMELSNGAVDFIDEVFLFGLLAGKRPAADRVREIIAKSLAKEALSVEETAQLLLADTPELIEEIFEAARVLKQRVYGNRIVLFAPLYIGNKCVNDCSYCAFKRSNATAIRRTLTEGEIREQVESLESRGHKRLILVFGEHQAYDAEFIAKSVQTVYDTRVDHGEIRRININAAPLDHEGYRIVKETYHHETYARLHPRDTRKSNYLYRLDGLSRAFEASCDDVGLGVLFGLADWRFEVLGLVTHALHLQQRYNVGPHTISFPRLRPAAGVEIDNSLLVRDDDFKRIIAILRLAVPYTGLILTARENAQVRRECMSFGVSQIDAGSRIDLGGYTEAGDAQVMEREQFSLADVRSLDEVMAELMNDGYLPSFCTSCYRVGRTGEHFMEFSIPGFIKEFCTPNGLMTLEEYLVDYASEATRMIGERLIAAELAKLPDGEIKRSVAKRLIEIRSGQNRDQCF